jgi:hypothetical protein
MATLARYGHRARAHRWLSEGAPSCVDGSLDASGECQASCRMAYVMIFVYATPLFRVFDWLWSKAAWTTASRSGLSVTAAIGVQFRV